MRFTLLMSHSKPKVVGAVRPVCPVCGTTAYSSGGIHPQCAVVRADQVAPRPKETAVKTKPLTQWRKRCPRCKRDLPARRMMCDCGHSFQPRPPGWQKQLENWKDLFMLRLAIVDKNGKIVPPAEVPTAAELVALVDQARNVIRDCEQAARQLNTKVGGAGSGTAPYMS
jgi:hypothetical protein